MKRLIWSLCILCIIMLFCCSCGFRTRYVCDVDEVKSVEIVKLNGIIEGEYQYDYSVLSEISDHATFVKRLNNLKHSYNWGEPSVMDAYVVVIRIEYHNGEFDLIHSDAQVFYYSGVNHSGYFFFDDDQFQALIEDYLAE